MQHYRRFCEIVKYAIRCPTHAIALMLYWCCMNAESFANFVRDQMRLQGISQAELAKMSGVSTSQISRILSTLSTPTQDVILAIARALKLPPETVFRAAGLLSPIDERQAAIEKLGYQFLELSPRDQEEILALMDFKLQQARLREEQQRAAKRAKTGPLPHLG